MPSSIKMTKKYQKNMDFAKELQHKKIFEKISNISSKNGEIIEEWQEDGFNWRLRSTKLSSCTERSISCCKILEENLTKKERKKQYIFKSCLIYDKEYIIDDKYKLYIDEYILTDIVIHG